MNADSVRALLRSKASLGDAIRAAAFGAFAWLFVGIVVFFILALFWDWMPPPLVFLAIFDALFVILAVGGETMRPEGEEMLSYSKTKHLMMVYGGGFWQVAKSAAKAILFAIPNAAVTAIRSVIPPLDVVHDAEAMRMLEQIARIRGGVALPLLRYLAGDPPARSVARAIDAAVYLDAIIVRRERGVVRIVPGPAHGGLAAVAKG